jgi:spore coat polysaccharide biosynthesis protein SpsF
MTSFSSLTAIITQARTGSTRLPGKIFMPVKGKPLLHYHLNRLLKTGARIIIATTRNEADNQVQEYAEENNLSCFRGSESNVLSRFYHAALANHLSTIVRVTSDCPLIDPQLISENLMKYNRLGNPDLYMSNTLERTFAIGFDFEIFSFKLLKEAFENASDPEDLEHVTPFIWKNKSGKTQFLNVSQPVNNSNLRVTVDTSEDFKLISHLIEKHHADTLSYSEIENVLLQHPELIQINAHIKQKKIAKD